MLLFASVAIIPFIFGFNLFSLYTLFFYNLFGVFSVFFLLFVFINFNRFLLSFYIRLIIFESVTDLISIFSFLLGDFSFFTLVLFFKLNLYPFITYQFLIGCFSMRSCFFILYFVLYLFLNKIVFLNVFVIIPVFYLDIFSLSLLSLLFIYFNFSFFNYIFNSFILSNLVLTFLFIFFSINVSILYLFLSSLLSYKILFLLYDEGDSFTYLSVLNGNPLFILNWVKFIIQVFFLNTSFIIYFVFVLIEVYYLLKSLIGIRFKLNNFSINIIRIFLFIVILLFLTFILFNSTFYYMFYYFTHPFYNFNLLSFNSYISFIILGENISLSIVLFFFIYNFYYNSLNINKFPNLEGLNPKTSLLKTSNKIYFYLFKSYSFSFNLDLVVLVFLYSNLFIFSNNFDFLVSDSVVFNGYLMPVVFILKQWKWYTYLSTFTTGHPFIYSFFNPPSNTGGGYTQLLITSSKLLWFSYFNHVKKRHYGSPVVYANLVQMEYEIAFRSFHLHTGTHHWHWDWEPSWLYRYGIRRLKLMYPYGIKYLLRTNIRCLLDYYSQMIRIRTLFCDYELWYREMNIRDNTHDYLAIEEQATPRRDHYFDGVLNSNMSLYCTSLDVIHSVFIKNLVLKIDVFYGKISYINLKDHLSFSVYDCYLELICYEYCGLFHHDMRSKFLILDDIDLSFIDYVFG